MNIVPDFSLSKKCNRPYPHAWIPRIFPTYPNDHILSWLERADGWKFTDTDFYRQFEFSLKNHPPPSELGFLTSSDTLDLMKTWLQATFNTQEIESTDIVAHLLEIGHGIGVHNDCIEHGETIRLLLHLNRKVIGGELVLFHDHQPESVCRIIRPKHGTAFAFIISECSYHAVPKVQEGRRFSIVYSFRPRK